MGRATSDSLASWELPAFSISSTLFHSVPRSLKPSGALGGSRISEWTVPPFLVYAVPLVCDFLAASVGGCCDCGFTAATADDLNAAMVNCDSTTSRFRLFRLVESE